MCGRYTLHLPDLSKLRVLLGVQRVPIPNWRPRYNIAPTQPAPVVLPDEPRTLQVLRWGLVPSGASDPKIGNRLINARVESLEQRPSFRRAFRERRCIVPATGYFEWQAQPGRRGKQPFWISPRDDASIMAFAGLFESSVSPQGDVLETFAIVTTDAAPEIRAIHDRMPLELRDGQIETWLARGPLSKPALAAMVQNAQDAAHLCTREVDRRVSTPAFDDPACIAPPSPEGVPVASDRQLDLFD
jgi:putative SOS response-associated peptidase YedK